MSTNDIEAFETTVPFSRSHGIHSGPSQRIVEFVRSTECAVRLKHGDTAADAASLMDLMTGFGNIGEGDEVTITTRGPNAQHVGMSLARFLTGMDEEFETQ